MLLSEATKYLMEALECKKNKFQKGMKNNNYEKKHSIRGEIFDRLWEKGPLPAGIDFSE